MQNARSIRCIGLGAASAMSTATSTARRTALLVIDLQRGAFDGVRCPVIAEPGRLMDNAVALVDAARAGGAAVVYIQHDDEAGAPFEPDTVHWRLHERFAPRDGEPCIRKRESSAFDGTGLHKHLSSLGVTDLVTCGLQSEFCVWNTSKGGLALGYAVAVAGDGHGTWPYQGRAAAEISAEINERLMAAGATVAPTAALAERLRAGGRSI